MSETRIDRLEQRLDGFDNRLRHVEEIVIRIDERLATLPTLVTKADLADTKAELGGQIGDTKGEPGGQIAGLRAYLANKPSRLYMWGVMAAMTAANTAALAAIGVLLTHLLVLHR